MYAEVAERGGLADDWEGKYFAGTVFEYCSGRVAGVYVVEEYTTGAVPYEDAG